MRYEKADNVGSVPVEIAADSYLSRAISSVSQITGTNSKHPESLIYGLYPTHVKGGSGCYLYDESDRRYIDYICGLGTNLMGYGNDRISQHMQKYIFTGFSHSLPSCLEVEVAEKLKEIFVFVDQWKFLKTGGDACLAAVRIARAMTGRDKVLSDGYHGWGDMFVSLTDPATGVPAHPDIEKFRGIDQIDESTAAVIIEPVMIDDSKDRIEYLKQLREACTRAGAILIFDEVITGFRYKKYGVSNSSGIEPDLICIGKAMANGMPLAAVGGKRELMADRRWFVSSTYSGEVLSLAACWKTIDLLQSDSRYDIDHLHSMGQVFMDEFNSMPGEIKLEGYATRGVFKGPEIDRAIFMQEMIKLGVLFGPSWFYNFDHIEHQDEILDLILEIKTRVHNGKVKLQFDLPKSPFSKVVRDD